MSAPPLGPALPLLVFGAIVALAGVAFYFARLAEKKRTAALFDAALRMGFTFEAKPAPDVLAALGPFHLFKRGHSQRARNLMRGKSAGAEIAVFDCTYVTGGGKNSQVHSQTVAVYPPASAAAALPEFTLGPEHWWHKIGELFGYQDINFEADEEFSKHYLLRGPDETAIRAAFGPNALGFFAQNQGWSVEAAGGALAVYRAERTVKPEEMQPFVAESAAVRRTLVRD